MGHLLTEKFIGHINLWIQLLRRQKVSPIRLLTYVASTGSYVFLLMYPILSKPRAIASISQAMGNVQGKCGTIKNELFGIILLKF